MADSSSKMSFTRRTFIAAGVAALLVLSVLLLWYLSTVLLLVFGGILVGVLLGGMATGIAQRTPLPRGAALGLSVLLIIGFFVAFGMLAGPRLSSELSALSTQIPKTIDQLQQQVSQVTWLEPVIGKSAGPEDMPGSGSGSGGGAAAVMQEAVSVVTTTFGALTNALIVIIIGLYLAISPALYTAGALHLVPHRQRDRGREVLKSMGHAMRWWFVGRFASMIVVGVLTAIGLLIAGVPLAFVLGVIAALFSFVPYIGPIASAVPALLVGLAEGPQTALYVVGVYVAVQFLESYLVTPLIQDRAVSIPPALLITAQVILGVLAGVLGVLLATPLAVVTIVLVQMVYVQDVIGDDVDVLGQA